MPEGYDTNLVLEQENKRKAELMAMNRKERRRFGKLIHMKIPGTSIPLRKQMEKVILEE